MHYSIYEQVQRFSKKRMPSNDQSGKLQTRIWLENLFRENKIGRRELEREISPPNSEPSGIVLKWLKGEHSVKESRVTKVASIFDGSDLVYKLPIFKLLKNKPISRSEISRIMKPYISNFQGFKCWTFPDIPRQKENKGVPFPPTWIYDVETLVERGDIWGFTAILYLVRMAEAERNAIYHLEFMQYLYRALPGLCRNVLFFRRWKDTYQCVKDIHFREPTSVLAVQSIDSVLKRQIFSKVHITRRMFRPRDPITGLHTELELPYKKASF